MNKERLYEILANAAQRFSEEESRTFSNGYNRDVVDYWGDLKIDARKIMDELDKEDGKVITLDPVGEVGLMPGTNGFTMAVFEASKVPVGTKLYVRKE